MVAGAAGNPEPNAVSPIAANNYASSLRGLSRFKEAKTLLRRTLPAAQRVLNEGNEIPLRMRLNYARALYKDDGATLDDLRLAVTMLEEIERTSRRVRGSAHPETNQTGLHLRDAQAALRARETPST